MSGIYTQGAAKFLDGTIDWTADDIKVALIDESDYTVDLVSDEFLDDIPGAAIVDTSANLTGKSVTGSQALADDAVAASTTGDDVDAVVVYMDSGSSATSPLIAYLSFAAPVSPNGGDFTIEWPGAVVFEVGAIAGVESTTFYHTGSSQDWVVPDGVISAHFVISGAAGGDGTGGAQGGKGVVITGIMDVTPGETLKMYVGGEGAQGVVATPGVGGFNGGGDSLGGATSAGGGGGGASDIRRGGTALGDRIAVAAGGGGGNNATATGSGGAGGQSDGSTGANGTTGAASGGGGASQSAGGIAGVGNTNGSAGAIGDGGDSGNSARSGGGGGGGYYGGGGGASGTVGESGGGGGGGSTLLPTDFDAEVAVAGGPGRITVSYGTPVSLAGPDVVTKFVAHTGAAESWVVPDGVDVIHVEMAGAGGGVGTAGSFAGSGAVLRGDLAVTAGETLQLNVGGRGLCAVAAVSRSLGGYNGGGNGGDAASTPALGNGGGGGGGTDIRQGGTALGDRVAAAGGGGGGGGNAGPSVGTGANAGIPLGVASAAAGSQGAAGGGTLSAGGAAGTGDSNGSAGSSGTGGAGGAVLRGGGGGGGGYYGGGGGAGANTGEQASGGGGGSSLIPASWTGLAGANLGNGWMVISYDRGLRQNPNSINEDAGVITSTLASTLGPVVTPGNGSKGNWTQISAGLASDIEGFELRLSALTGNGFLVDVGIGAASSETVLVPNLLLTGRSSQFMQYSYYIPIRIPAGTRIAVRAQSTTGSLTVYAVLNGYTHSEGPSYDGVDALGATGVYGTTITVPGSINTKGTPWIEVEDVTTHAFRALALGLSNSGSFAGTANGFQCDVAVGASSSEVIRLADLYAGADPTSDEIHPNWFGPFTCGVPNGSRISVRGQSSSTVQQWSGVVYGFWKTEDQ